MASCFCLSAQRRHRPDVKLWSGWSCRCPRPHAGSLNHDGKIQPQIRPVSQLWWTDFHRAEASATARRVSTSMGIWAKPPMASDPVSNAIESSPLVDANVNDKPGRANWSRCAGNIGYMWFVCRRPLALRVCPTVEHGRASKRT